MPEKDGKGDIKRALDLFSDVDLSHPFSYKENSL